MLMNIILLEDNLQQNFVSIKDSVTEMRFCTEILSCDTGALRKKFRESTSGKEGPNIFRKTLLLLFLTTWRNEIK